jgi:amino acid transporter
MDSGVISFVSAFVYMIALPVTHSTQGFKFADAADVFGSYQNFSGWGNSVAVPFTFFAVAWVVTGWAAPSYVAEETHNARLTAPRAVLSSYIATAALGGAICLISAFCIEDIEAAALDPR